MARGGAHDHTFLQRSELAPELVVLLEELGFIDKEALADHEADTTSVHGIVDTADLVTSADIAGFITEEDLNNHIADTTNVHGIVDTAQLVTKAELVPLATDADVAGALNAHRDDTTAIHGIEDTSALALKSELPSTIKWRETHTFTIPDEVKVPSGDTDFIPPFFVMLGTGQTAQIISARHRINSGTSATVKIQKNGEDLTGFTGISVTTTSTTTDPANQNIGNEDRVALVVTGVSGTPKNLTFSVVVEHTLTL